MEVRPKAVCIHQAFSTGSEIPIVGRGNCSKCKPDLENNSKCSGFYPAPQVRFFTVKEELNTNTDDK
jgi:hypothetical protein